MGYGRTKQERIDQFKKAPENHLTGTTLAVAVGITASLLAGVGAGIGALVGLTLSFASLSPFIAGGIIGSALPAVLFTAALLLSECGVLNKCIDYLLPLEENKKDLKEYFQSTEYKVTFYTGGIVWIGVSFGIGAGLVALGFTSPAAIGALAVLASLVASRPLNWLINKAFECFSSKENEKPGGFLGEGVDAAKGNQKTCLG